jgi:hypothetical protein
MYMDVYLCLYMYMYVHTCMYMYMCVSLYCPIFQPLDSSFSHSFDVYSLSSSNSKVTAVVYWRPSDALSVRAVTILENLQRAFPQFFSVVSILAPRYPSERILSTEEEGKDKNVLDSLLIPGEKPTNILLDANLESFRDLTVHHWPSVFICLKKGSDVAGSSGGASGGKGGESKAKIIFALESQRAVSGMVSKSISAVLSVIQYSEEKAQAIADAEKSGEDIKYNQASDGMWGRNFDAIYTGTPLLPYIAATAKKEQLSRPMRLTISNKNSLLYISDTGTYFLRFPNFIPVFNSF